MDETQLRQFFRTRWKEALERILPHRYSMPPWSYPADDAPIQGLCHLKMLEDRMVQPSQNHANWFVATNLFETFGSRVYAVTPELVKDLSHTSLKGLDMPSLKWPLGAFCIAFPRETVFLNKDDGYLTGMLVSRGTDNPALYKMARAIGADYEAHSSDPQKFVVCSATSSGAAYSCNAYEEDFNLDKLGDLSFDITLLSGEVVPVSSEGDRSTSRNLVEVFVKILSYMNARPSDLELGALKAKAKNKSKKHAPKPDWWKPWIVGLDRQKNPKMIAGTNPTERGSCIPHWRCGHWRHVRYGKGFEQARLAWIEPVMVNKEKSCIK